MCYFNLRFLSLSDLKEVKQFNKTFIHPSDYGAGYMADKASRFNIYAENLRDPAVGILKETILSCGGELVSNHNVLIRQCGTSAVVMMLTKHQAEAIIPRLKMQQFGLPQFAAELEELFAQTKPQSDRVIPYNGGELVFGKRTLIMGILNCTPDSFSDGGLWFDTDCAVEHAFQMEADGADIIDIGGESTRPGSAVVTAEEELNRILPVLERLKGKLRVPISVDTYKAETAKVALEAGAAIINDVWGFQYDHGEMAAVAAEADCPIILMRNKDNAIYDDFMAEMMAYLRRSIKIAVDAGCDRNKIIVDPGFGFGTEKEHNLLLTNKLKEMTSLGCPVLMAASHKKTVGLVLDAPADQRMMGDAAVTAISIANGADMIRVHDVKEMVQVAKMADAIVRQGGYC